MLKKIIFSSAIVMTGSVLAAPLSFTTQPSFPQTVSPSTTATLSYTVSNNINQSLPLPFSAKVNAGSITSGSGCGATLAAKQTCTETFTYTAPASGTTDSGSISVNYGGQYPLTGNAMSFSISSGGGGGTATMVVSPNPAGVAIDGITTTGSSFYINHPGTQQFTAVEISATGVVNTSPSVTWTSSTSNATIGSTTGLATGVASGATTITATDSSDSSIYGSVTLTVKAIGATQIIGSDSGLVYCMGTGTDVTNCAYLPSGKIGGMIATTDANSGSAIEWDTESPYQNTNAISLTNGQANTATLIAGGSRYAAANLCTGSWYLPATNELQVIAMNVLALNSSSAALSTSNQYWSSTEITPTPNDSTNPADLAWSETLDDGFQNFSDKDYSFLVRCAQVF